MRAWLERNSFSVGGLLVHVRANQRHRGVSLEKRGARRAKLPLCCVFGENGKGGRAQWKGGVRKREQRGRSLEKRQRAALRLCQSW